MVIVLCAYLLQIVLSAMNHAQADASREYEIKNKIVGMAVPKTILILQG